MELHLAEEVRVVWTEVKRFIKVVILDIEVL